MSPTEERIGAPILKAVVGTLAGVILIFVALAWMLAEFPDTETVPVDPEAPAPEERLEAARARDRETLSSYGWIDREQGIARLPIEQAMPKLIEERSQGK